MSKGLAKAIMKDKKTNKKSKDKETKVLEKSDIVTKANQINQSNISTEMR